MIINLPNSLLITLGLWVCFAACSEKNKTPNTEIPSFIKITNGNTLISDTTITCEIFLEHLPTELIFDNENLPNAFLEYQWAVHFDNDLDGKYDIVFSLSNFRFDVEEQMTKTIYNGTQSNIWEIKESYGDYFGNLVHEIEDNKIKLSVTGLHQGLKGISKQSKIKYESYYNTGSQKFIDSLISSI